MLLFSKLLLIMFSTYYNYFKHHMPLKPGVMMLKIQLFITNSIARTSGSLKDYIYKPPLISVHPGTLFASFIWRPVSAVVMPREQWSSESNLSSRPFIADSNQTCLSLPYLSCLNYPCELIQLWNCLITFSSPQRQ